jgi:hypothetical protein
VSTVTSSLWGDASSSLALIDRRRGPKEPTQNVSLARSLVNMGRGCLERLVVRRDHCPEDGQPSTGKRDSQRDDGHGTRRPCFFRAGTRPALAEAVRFIAKPKVRSGRAKPATEDDPLFALIGIGRSKTLGGMSDRKHEALARAYRPRRIDGSSFDG